MLPTLMKNYTIVVTAFESIGFNGLDLSGPRLSLCAPTIELNYTNINASGKGCESNTGLGAGVKGEYCAG